jgi:hypothetical protein
VTKSEKEEQSIALHYNTPHHITSYHTISQQCDAPSIQGREPKKSGVEARRGQRTFGDISEHQIKETLGKRNTGYKEGSGMR